MTDNKNNQELLLLNQKLDFLTLSYISILDNAIKNIVHKIDKNLLIYEKKEEGDIFGTLNFIQNFKNLQLNESRIRILKELNSNLIMDIDEESSIPNSASDGDKLKRNFYILYANIYYLRQKIVHEYSQKKCENNAKESNNNLHNNFNKLLKKIEETQSLIPHYEHLILLLPISFSYHIKNLFFAINERYKNDENSNNLNEIEKFIARSRNKEINYKKNNFAKINEFEKVKFLLDIPIKKSPKFNKISAKQKIISLKEFNFIGKKNYKDLQNLIKKINQDFPPKNLKKTNKIISKKEINNMIFFEEIERIYKLLIEINVLFRMHFTRFYNFEKDNLDLENKINKLNQTNKNDLIKNANSILSDVEKFCYHDFFNKTLRNIQKKFTNNPTIRSQIQEIIDISSGVNNPNCFVNCRKLRNNVDHSNFFGIFQTSENEKFSLKNFQINLSNIQEFLQNFSKNSDDKSINPDFYSFKNQLIQALSKKDYLQIKSQHKDDIKLHKVRLDIKFEKTCVNNQKIFSRKESNKEKIIDVIEKHKEKIRKQHSKSKSEYRLFKFFHYAEFKTVIIKKGLKKIKNN